MKEESLKTQTNLTLNFEANDVIDVLVSEQEQNIETQISSLEEQVKTVKDEIKMSDVAIEKYVKDFVKTKYSDKIALITNVFETIHANAAVSFEIIDGNDLPRRGRRVLTNTSAYEDKSDKILVALVICNKEFDRNTVDNTVSFYLESDYDDQLKQMNRHNEELHEKVQKYQDQIQEYEKTLAKTDQLIRKAKSVITRKAIGSDVEVFLDEFKKKYMSEIKQIKQV
jgi:septal ring factor EnvC (AmiA/AmiB activator)